MSAIRTFLRSGIAALGIFSGVEAASAGCGSPYTTITRPGGGYACYRDCTMAAGTARELSRRTVSGPRDVYRLQSDCISACIRTPGCTSVSFRDWYKGGVHYASCVMWTGSSEATMTPRPAEADGRDWWVCQLDAPGALGRDPRLQPPETNLFQQDQIRPGVPIPRGK